MSIETRNPTTGELIKEFPEMEIPELCGIIDKTHETFLEWRRKPFSERAQRFYALADTLERQQNELARMMAEEMGKPVKQGVAEAKKCAWVCRYYAEHAESMLQDESVDTDFTKSYVSYQPEGVILAVMPWNYPLWQVFRAAAPALMAGNTMVLKHASNVPRCALTIEGLFDEAGFPRNTFRTLLVGSSNIAVAVVHNKVRAVTLTGSTEAGKKLAAQAGSQIKKSVLELGGSDAYLVLEDADIDEAAKTCAAGRMLNGGQSCIAAKRFIVHAAVREAFEKALVAAMESYEMGDPMDENTPLGPQARADLRDSLHEQVTDSIDKGARVLLGCEVPDRQGAWYPASVLTDVKPGMPAFDDELFGPVASVITASSEAEAIELANQSSFGLGGGVFTRDLDRGERIAREELDAGCCFVNDFVKSDPRLPFGGVKDSGYGRELGSFGIKEFVNIKTVVVK